MPRPKQTDGHLAADRSANWTIQLPNGQQHGPLSGPEIQALVESGVIPTTSLAWNPQVGSWLRVVDIVSPIVANHGSGTTSLAPRVASSYSPKTEPELAQLFDHIQGDRQRIDCDRQQQARSKIATANEVKTVSEWAGRVVAAVVGIVLLMIAVFAWAGAGPQNFNLGRVALVPMLLAGATAALVSWILPYFYSSRRRSK